MNGFACESEVSPGVAHVNAVQSGYPAGDCWRHAGCAVLVNPPWRSTDCAANPTERTRPHDAAVTVRLNRWWRFPTALWSAATDVDGDTNGDGKGTDLALGCRVLKLKEDINNAFHQLV